MITGAIDDLPVDSPVKMLPVTKASLTGSQHVRSWCWIKIKERDPGSLSVPLVRPVRCRRRIAVSATWDTSRTQQIPRLLPDYFIAGSLAF